MSLHFIFMVLYAIFVVISVISLVIPVISVISVNPHTVTFILNPLPFITTVNYKLLYSKRIYSANGISHSFFSSHKCFFKTYKNAFKWNTSNWD